MPKMKTEEQPCMPPPGLERPLWSNPSSKGALIGTRRPAAGYSAGARRRSCSPGRRQRKRGPRKYGGFASEVGSPAFIRVTDRQMRIETENRKMGEKSTGRNIPLLAEEGWLRHQENAAKRPKRRRRGGQT